MICTAWQLRLMLTLLCLEAHCARGQDAVVFRDATEAFKLHFRHVDGGGDAGFLVSLMGSGQALFDFDRDGLPDAFLLNGIELPTGAVPTNGLFRNVHGRHFSNVTAAARVRSTKYGLGISVGDIDNDGFQDAVLSNFNSVTLLRNNGDGTFVDQTNASGLSNSGVHFGAGVAFLDIENDGDLDLYVADYVGFTFEQHERSKNATYPYPPGPEQFPHRHDRLFLNDGSGVFLDISEASGISSVRSPSMGVACADFDGDRDTDIFVCCDARPDLLWVNDGNGNFTNEAEIFAVAYPATGLPIGSMGADFGDVDNDGLEDLFITSYSAQMPVLFRSLGELGFEDATLRSRAGVDVKAHANWGNCLVDVDNDGSKDLLIANGHLLKNASQIEDLTNYKVANKLLINDGTGRFRVVQKTAGSGLEIVESSRGIGFDDFDGDGDLDCVVLNSNSMANYLENQSPNDNHWIEFELVGLSSNRDGVGGKITVETGSHSQAAERRSGRGYQSYYGSLIHFGLADAQQVDRIQVDWMGKTQVFENIPVNRKYVLIESSEVLH